MYSSYDISFPSFGVTVKASRVAFSFFGKSIYWYGVIIAFGFDLAVLYILKRCKSFGVNQDDFLNCLLIGTPAGVICARIYYVVFNYSAYAGDLAGIFRIWEGGLGMYGVVIGAALSVIIYCRVKKVKMLPILDLVVLGLLIGQTLGRWGNFMNREAFGLIPQGASGALRSVLEFFRMDFVNGADRISVQPTFLYESVWNLAGFIVLHFASKKRKFDGQTALMYLAWYGFGRFFIEGLRTDSLYLFSTGIRVSQLVAAITCVCACAILAYVLIKVKPDPAKMAVNAVSPAAAAADAEERAGEELPLSSGGPSVSEPEPEIPAKPKVSHEDIEKQIYEQAHMEGSAINRPFVPETAEALTPEKEEARRKARAKMIAEARELGLILDEDGNFIAQVDPVSSAGPADAGEEK